MSSYRYQVFGMTLGSTRPLPMLHCAQDSNEADVQLVWSDARNVTRSTTDERVWYERPHVSCNGEPALIIWKSASLGQFRLQYVGGPEFVIRDNGSQLEVRNAELLTLDALSTYLLGPVLSFVVLLKGSTPLHASAVAIDLGAIIFVGPTGAGKSTLAAALGASGCPVLSDDLVSLRRQRNTWHASSGFARLRLGTDVGSLLETDFVTPPVLERSDDGEFLDLNLHQPGYKFESGSRPVMAIYLLSREFDDYAAPALQAVSRSAAVQFLMANTWTVRVLDRDMLQNQFETLSQLLLDFECQEVRGLRGPGRLADACELVINHARRTMNSSRHSPLTSLICN